jgi:hypothetical protein
MLGRMKYVALHRSKPESAHRPLLRLATSPSAQVGVGLPREHSDLPVVGSVIWWRDAGWSRAAALARSMWVVAGRSLTRSPSPRWRVVETLPRAAARAACAAPGRPRRRPHQLGPASARGHRAVLVLACVGDQPCFDELGDLRVDRGPVDRPACVIGQLGEEETLGPGVAVPERVQGCGLAPRYASPSATVSWSMPRRNSRPQTGPQSFPTRYL